MAPVVHPARTAPAMPRLEAGDHLDQVTFHERYQAMPPAFRAELIGGVVMVPSPLLPDHGAYHALVMTWRGPYWMATPGTRVRDNATAILGPGSEPQPEAALIIDPASGGQTAIAAAGYAAGPPELIVDVASSSAAIDLHSKRDDYERAGVLEYIVVVVRQGVVRCFVLHAEGRYREGTAAVGGLFTSTVFPGLWLDPAALLHLAGRRLMATLHQGLAPPEHAAFVQHLQARRRV